MTIDMTKKLSRPVGHHTLVPGFAIPNAAKVIGFLERAFNAKVVDRYDGPNGVVYHAELLLGDSALMLGDAGPDHPEMPGSLSFYVDNGEAVDRTYKRALDNGAKSISEPKNMFYGWRSACVQDVGGNRWNICAIVEELTKEQIEQRMKDQPK
jgi:PhnB protein